MRPCSKYIDIILTLTSHYMKEAQATHPERGKLHYKLIQWLWGVIAVKSHASLSVVMSTEQDLDLKLMLASAVHRRIGRARRALSSSRLDARGAHPVHHSSLMHVHQWDSCCAVRFDMRGARYFKKKGGRARPAPIPSRLDARGARPVHQCLIHVSQ